jgi:hypothetical protein
MSLKILLNQSSALYILVAGQKFYNIIQTRINNNKEDDGDLPIEYTLFTDRLYIESANWVQLDEYLDKIAIYPSYLYRDDFESFHRSRTTSSGSQGPRYIQSWELSQLYYNYVPMSEEQRGKYFWLKKSLCFQCSGSFVDLRRIISERLFYIERSDLHYANNQYPHLDISLTETEKKSGELQTILESVYNKGFHSNTLSKENLLIFLYTFLQNFSRLSSGDYFTIIANYNGNQTIQFKNSNPIELDSDFSDSTNHLIKEMKLKNLLRTRRKNMFIKV